LLRTTSAGSSERCRGRKTPKNQQVFGCRVWGKLIPVTHAKIGIVGAGAVGSACLISLIPLGCAREIVLVDRTPRRALGVVTDAQYGAVLSPPITLRAGDYSDLAGSALVMITVGLNEKAGGATDRNDPAGRLKLLETNAGIFRDVVPQVHRAAGDAIVLVVTDPPDPLADVVRMLGHERVLSTGTFLDSLRFRFQLARRLNVRPADVDAHVVGEHGTSEVFLWSTARVGGRPVLDLLAADGEAPEKLREDVERDVRYANITVIEGIGASQYGIGMVSARIAEIVLRDERSVIPIGSYQAAYGVTLSLPSVVGREGVRQVLQPEMTGEERQGFERSAETLQHAVAGVTLVNTTAAT
jgi:L-lactate dehydrogenase